MAALANRRPQGSDVDYVEFDQSSDFARALAFALFCTRRLRPVSAKPHAKKSHTIFEATVAIVSPPTSPASARFFTINQIMARHEGRIEQTESFRLAAAIQTDHISDEPIPAPSRPKAGDEPFGLLMFRAPEGPLWAKWRAVEAEMKAEENVLDQCRLEPDHCASPAARHYLALVEEARHSVGRARADTINNLINNAIHYTGDLEQHGVIDVWMAPLATLASGRGDCKDYAIAKYFALRDAGVAAEDLRLAGARPVGPTGSRRGRYSRRRTVAPARQSLLASPRGRRGPSIRAAVRHRPAGREAPRRALRCMVIR